MKKRDVEYNKMLKEFRRLAKKADQRLVRLEELSTHKGFNNVLSWSYRKAMKDIKYWAGEKATRFNAAPPRNMGMLKAKIRDIQSFLDMSTSTKKGIMKTYKKRADTLNKRYGTNFTWESIADYFERGQNEQLDAKYGSKTMIMAIGEIQKNEKTIVRNLKNGKPVDIRTDNAKVQQAVMELIAEKGIGVVDLY